MSKLTLTSKDIQIIEILLSGVPYPHGNFPTLNSESKILDITNKELKSNYITSISINYILMKYHIYILIVNWELETLTGFRIEEFEYTVQKLRGILIQKFKEDFDDLSMDKQDYFLLS